MAINLYPGVSALDAVGPWEVLSRMPNTEVWFVGKEVGPLMAEGGTLLLGVTHTLAETPSPDLLLVPGGTTTPGEMVDDEVLGHLHGGMARLLRFSRDPEVLIGLVRWVRLRLPCAL